MKKKLIFFILGLTFIPMMALAQKVNPMAYYTDSVGVTLETRNISDGEAPLDVTFRANPSEMDDFDPSYEWHFRKMHLSEGYEELFVRYEEDTQYTFNESGTYNIVLKTKLEREDIMDPDSVVITITISESRLKFPNAFSPNGDGINDIFGAKGANDPGHPEHYKNIVEFRAIIINRWGQKLYEWTDLDGGWDGTFHGHPVKDGVYFLQVNAKGADGKKYHIRKDINLLRGYTEGGNSSGTQ